MNFLNDGRHSPAFLGEKATEGIDKEEGKAMREKEMKAKLAKVIMNPGLKPWLDSAPTDRNYAEFDFDCGLTSLHSKLFFTSHFQQRTFSHTTTI